MKRSSKYTMQPLYLLGLAALVSALALVKISSAFTGQGIPMMDSYSSAAPAPVVTSGDQCSENGVQICQCYCRTSLTTCQDGSASNASLPLCREEWSGGDCSAIGYYFTESADSASCSARNGSSCTGHIRPGNGNPTELGNAEVQGQLLGCGIVAL